MQKIKQFAEKIWHPLVLITLFSIPFQIRKVLFPVFENGYFHETLSISIYLSDILVILCITCGLIIYIADVLRMATPLLLKLQRAKADLRGILKNPLFWLSLFILWQCATLFRANNVGIALFRIFKIIEMASFGIILYLVFNQIQIKALTLEKSPLNISLPKNEKYKFSCFLSLAFCFLIAQSVIQSIWAIFQFIFQKSFGLAFLKESVLSPAIPGVAKIIINGKKYIRGYGGLPHPNILAGFLFLSIACSLIWILKPKLKLTKLTLLCSSVYYKVTLVWSIFVIQFIGFMFASSLSALLSLIIFCIVTLLYSRRCHKLTLLCSSVYYKVTLVLIILAVFAGGILFLRKTDILSRNSSILERAEQYRTFIQVLKNKKNQASNTNWIYGIGTGNYVSRLVNVDAKTQIREPWQKQPAHNIFLLILAENGGIGLVLFSIFLFSVFKTNLFLASFLPIMFFDHYLYTSQQGILIFIVFYIISTILCQKLPSKEPENWEKISL